MVLQMHELRKQVQAEQHQQACRDDEVNSNFVMLSFSSAYLDADPS